MKSSDPKNSGSPRRRSPILYYGQLWVDKDMFDLVRQFADWENLSMKAAAHQLFKTWSQ